MSLDVNNSNDCSGEHRVAEGEQSAVGDAELSKGAVEVVLSSFTERGRLCHVQTLAVASDAW